MEQRDRASGWKYAKLSGHRNEDLVKDKLDCDPDYAAAFLRRLGYTDEYITVTSVGGLHETDVPSACGCRKTKSKTDLKVCISNGDIVNISIKKSLSGQVYFVRAGRFIETFEKQFQQAIPDSVKRAISLFWAAADDAPEIIRQYADRSSTKSYELQMRHHSLNATTLWAYDQSLYGDLLNWFTVNASQIAALCFGMGAVRDTEEWSDFVWYVNLLGEHDIDALFSIRDICHASENHAQTETVYGATNGGTTIQLPFGFVQWHQGQLQFHHQFEKVSHLVRPRGY